MRKKLVLGLLGLAMAVTMSGCGFNNFILCFLAGQKSACDQIGPAASVSTAPEAAPTARTINYTIVMGGAIVDRGTHSRRGSKRSARNVYLLGSFQGRARRPRRSTASRLDLRRFTRGSWHAKMNVSGDSRTKTGGANGISIATFSDQRAGELCISWRVNFAGTPRRPRITGRFHSTGGTGDGARVRATGRLTYVERRDGSFVAKGPATFSEGRARPAPANCRAVKDSFF